MNLQRMRLCDTCQRMCPASHFYPRSGKPRCAAHLTWPLHRRYKVMELLNRGKSNAQIAKTMDTTEAAIVLMRRRYGIEGAAKTKMTSSEVARVMGIGCAKTVVRWIAEGWLDGIHGYKQGPSRVWLVERVDLYGFVENEDAWHVWTPERITDPQLRAYAERVRGDVRFLTPREAGHELYVEHKTINSWIHKGVLPARRFGNWHIDARDVARLKRERHAA